MKQALWIGIIISGSVFLCLSALLGITYTKELYTKIKTARLRRNEIILQEETQSK